MKKYTFTLSTLPKLCPLPCEEASVVVEMTGSDSASLMDLADALLAVIGFDPDHAFGFYEEVGMVYQNKGKSYTVFTDMGEDEGATGGVRQTPITALFSPGDTRLFHFDYGDDWHFSVTCEGIEDSQAKRASVKCREARGPFPSQYGEQEDWDDEEWDDEDGGEDEEDQK